LAFLLQHLAFPRADWYSKGALYQILSEW
jgi:hypothetical protein